jgi:carbon-monoxide dehydrogenase small subunit
MTEFQSERRISVTVNGDVREAVVEVRRLLVDFVRHDLGLTGTHVGCEQGVCGACTVLLNGDAVRSCLMFAVQADGATVTTIEGIGSPEDLHPVQAAFRAHHGLQCGFCTPGMVLCALALIEGGRNLDEDAVREGLAGNLCRCTGYEGIVDAVLDAARERRT